MEAEFFEEEVKAALDSCGSSKSPGPDGFNFGFLKENWDLFKEDFMKMFSEFHMHGKLVKGLNPSFIVLIQKRTMHLTSRTSGRSPSSEAFTKSLLKSFLLYLARYWGRSFQNNKVSLLKGGRFWTVWQSSMKSLTK